MPDRARIYDGACLVALERVKLQVEISADDRAFRAALERALADKMLAEEKASILSGQSANGLPGKAQSGPDYSVTYENGQRIIDLKAR